MRKTVLFLSLILSANPLWAQTAQTLAPLPPSTPTELPFQWTLGVEGQHFEDRYNRDLINRFQLRLRASEEFESRFRLFGDLLLQAEQGQSQGLDNEPNRRESGVFLLEAGAEARFGRPDLGLNLATGALNAGENVSDLLLSSQTFPALRQQAHWKRGRTLLSLSAIQAIPTSTTLSSKAVEKEPTPYYLMETLAWNQHWTPAFRTHLRVSHFQFVNLPDKVAFESRLFGNSVQNLDLNRGRFLYDFEGYQPEAAFTTDFGRMELHWKTQYLINTGAPSGQNQGLSHQIGWESALSSRWATLGAIGVFENQSDSSPAFYNSWKRGHNNTQGEYARLGLVFARASGHEIRILADFVQSRVVKPNPYQSDAKLIQLSLETGYED